MIRDYGFDESKVTIEPEAFILGSTSKLPNIIYRPDGQWPTLLYEPQAETYETWGCTAWGTQNQIEMFEKEVYDFEPNYDERFTYIDAGIKVGGANPQDVYQSIRHTGLIPNEPLPSTYAEFIDKKYMTAERKAVAAKWTKQYKLHHDWLQDTSKETIVGALSLSPIGVSVTAWEQDEHGLYIDQGKPNTHWCVAFGYERNYKGVPGISLKVFDSYDHSIKYLHPNHRIAFAKRIWLEKLPDFSDVPVSQKNPLFTWLAKMLAWLFTKQGPMPEVPNEIKPEPKSRIPEWADAVTEREGYGKPNAITITANKNPGALRSSPFQTGTRGGFAIFPDYPTGRKALEHQLTICANGKSMAGYKPTDTLLQWASRWAPDHDNNDSLAYAKFVAKRLNVPIDTEVSSLL